MMHTYEVTVNDQDLFGFATVEYDHIGFDEDGYEVIQITTERDVSAQLSSSPAVVAFKEISD